MNYYFLILYGNNYLMRSSNNYDRIDMLKQLAMNTKYSAKLSVSVNLSRHGINSKESVFTMLRFLDSLGIKSLRLNELAGTEEGISIQKVFPDFLQ